MQYPSGTGASPVSSEEHGRGAHATRTPPLCTYPSNCFVGKYPSAFPCAFCIASMNGTSSSVPARMVIWQRGVGTIISCDIAHPSSKDDGAPKQNGAPPSTSWKTTTDQAASF